MTFFNHSVRAELNEMYVCTRVCEHACRMSSPCFPLADLTSPYLTLPDLTSPYLTLRTLNVRKCLTIFNQKRQHKDQSIINPAHPPWIVH